MVRKIYTSEFKEQAVKLSYASGKSVAETAADLGLPTNMLHRWRREAKQTGRVFRVMAKRVTKRYMNSRNS